MTDDRTPHTGGPGPSDPTRRGFLTAAAAGAGALMLAGCGGGESERSGGGGGSAGRFPARVRHKYGTTEIARAPKRVACIGYIDSDTVLALGVSPVLIRTNAEEFTRGVGPWSEGRLPDPAPVVMRAELDLEQLAAQRPDLIISVTDEIERKDYERLSQLAPTVAPPDGYPPYGVPWDVATKAQSAALGRAADGERLIRRARASIAAARRTMNAPPGSTAAITTAVAGGQFYVFADTDVRGNLIRELGLRQPDSIAKEVGSEFFAEISEERLDILEGADVLVDISYEAGSEKTLRNSRAWQALPAVREGRLVTTRGIPEGLAAQTGTSVSIPYVMPRLAPRLREAFSRVQA